MGPEKLTDKQEFALSVLTREPRKASELGVAAATLVSLVKKGYVGKVDGSPAKYFKIERKELPAGGVMLKTVDGEDYDFNAYTVDRATLLDVRWNDLNGNPHYGRMLRARPEDGGFYIRSREFLGEKFIKWEDVAVVAEEDKFGNFKREIYRRGGVLNV